MPRRRAAAPGRRPRPPRRASGARAPRARARGRARRPPRPAPSSVAARAADERATARAGSARPPRARRSRPRRAGSMSSTIANGSTNSVWPELDESCTTPGTFAARRQLHREHGPAAALGDERLLQRLAQLGRARHPLELLARPRCVPFASSPRRRRSAGEAVSRRPVPSSSTQRSIDSASRASAGLDRRAQPRAAAARARRLVEHAPRLERDPHRPRDRVQLARARARRRGPPAPPPPARPRHRRARAPPRRRSARRPRP